jgi:hypothetical protein
MIDKDQKKEYLDLGRAYCDAYRASDHPVLQDDLRDMIIGRNVYDSKMLIDTMRGASKIEDLLGVAHILCYFEEDVHDLFDEKFQDFIDALTDLELKNLQRKLRSRMHSPLEMCFLSKFIDLSPEREDNSNLVGIRFMNYLLSRPEWEARITESSAKFRFNGGSWFNLNWNNFVLFGDIDVKERYSSDVVFALLKDINFLRKREDSPPYLAFKAFWSEEFESLFGPLKHS